IREKIDAPALVTGESVGQVASQTLSNIRAVADAASLPILRPLSGMNKDEIIDQAKLIGTYPISIEPYQDCCSFFVPVHPETKANLDQILNIERSIDLSELLNNALERAELIKIDRNGIISNP
ncbi:MAG: tRNA 4-thiouridine(8) synthase ThiI, partial [Fidelibacterota bacterium]